MSGGRPGECASEANGRRGRGRQRTRWKYSMWEQAAVEDVTVGEMCRTVHTLGNMQDTLQ